MPGFNGTGPMGTGPLTGGGRGLCSTTAGRGEDRPSVKKIFGRGGGRSHRNCYHRTGLPGWMRIPYNYTDCGKGLNQYTHELTVHEEMDMLQQQAQILKNHINNIQSRINTLEKELDT